MSIPLLRVDASTYRELGQQQGQSWGPQARELFEIRMALTAKRSRIQGMAELRALAQAHLPVLEAFDAGLADELQGLSETSGLQPWELVILNHYTDFRDIPPDAGGCSVVYAPGRDGPLVGQTWDMHGTAMPYTALLQLTPPDGPPLVIFTVTGCFGMAGMNADGVAVCINNLTSNDARVGILWPALVRRMLRERSASDAVEVLQRARLSSGHNYLVADAKTVFNVEATATQQRVTHSDTGRLYWHTNHYLDEELQALEMPLHPESTSLCRYGLVQDEVAAGVNSLDSLWKLLASHKGHPSSICSHMRGDDPAASRTCGAIVCDPIGRRVLGVRGCLRESEPLTVAVG